MSEKRKPMRNYEFCYGMGVNWVDMNTGRMYHIQEYREAIERGGQPKGIRVSMWGNPDATIDYIGEFALRDLMKDPDPDPKY